MGPMEKLTARTTGSIPRGLFGVLSYQDAFNIQTVRLTGVFQFLCICASGNFRGVLSGKAAISLQHGVIGRADFVEEAQGRWLLSELGRVSGYPKDQIS
jgi:hypothetical protein